jgi:hypothetical protein
MAIAASVVYFIVTRRLARRYGTDA